MLLTLLTMAAFALAMAWLLYSVGAQYPSRDPQQAGRPDEEERQIRIGGMAGATPSVIARRSAAQRPGVSRRAMPPVTAAVAEVDRGLAAVMIEEAESAGGKRRMVARAQRALARGNRRADDGRYDRAAVLYGKAWIAASKAWRSAV